MAGRNQTLKILEIGQEGFWLSTAPDSFNSMIPIANDFLLTPVRFEPLLLLCLFSALSAISAVKILQNHLTAEVAEIAERKRRR